MKRFGWLAMVICLVFAAGFLTSNADALVPANLIVGYVDEVRDEDLDGIPRVRVRPALDLDRSTRVFVLLPL